MAIEINATTVMINGEIVPVAKKPKYKRGVPKNTTKTALVGNKTVPVQTRDFSEAMGEVTVTVHNTPENIALVESWQDNAGKNSVVLLDQDTSWTMTFNKMAITEDVEFDFDSDDTEVTFQGGQGA